MMTRNTTISMLVLFLAACGGGDDGSGRSHGGKGGPGPTGSGGTGTPPPEAPATPSLVSSSPANGAADVLEDDVITLIFSHPMDKASVEGSLYCAALADAMTFEWNANGSELTIIPDAPLPLAHGIGTDPSEINANYFEIIVGTAAMSEEGANLASNVVVAFHTYKEMEATFEIDPALTGYIDGDDWYVSEIGEPLRVGDVPANEPTRSFVSFDFSAMPETADIVRSASWAGRMTSTIGDPETIDVTTRAYHLPFTSLGEEAFTAAPSSMVGAFAGAGDVIFEVDVTSKVQDDLDNRGARGDRSQYRIQFDVDSNNDGGWDYYEFDAGLMELTVVYLAR